MDWFKGAILSALGVIAFSVFHYYVIALPRLERVRIEREAQERAKKEEKEKPSEALSKEPPSTSILEGHEKAARDLQAHEQIESWLRDYHAKEEMRQEAVARKAQAEQEREKIRKEALAREAQADRCIEWTRNLPQSTDAFDQLFSSYGRVLCGRLRRGEITFEEAVNLSSRMSAGIQLEKQKLAAELSRQRLEWEQRQQAIQALQGAAQAQRQAALAQQQAAQAQYQAAAQQQAFQQYWANWAQDVQRRMQNPINCNGRSLGRGMFTVDCN